MKTSMMVLFKCKLKRKPALITMHKDSFSRCRLRLWISAWIHPEIPNFVGMQGTSWSARFNFPLYMSYGQVQCISVVLIASAQELLIIYFISKTPFISKTLWCSDYYYDLRNHTCHSTTDFASVTNSTLADEYRLLQGSTKSEKWNELSIFCGNVAIANKNQLKFDVSNLGNDDVLSALGDWSLKSW